MYALEIREREIFETLKKIKEFHFVVIGGYAVNVYTLPRFSIDCDIVVNTIDDSEKIETTLQNAGYCKTEESKLNTPYHGEFIRYEKVIEENFKVSFDILKNKIVDRQTGAVLSAEWVFEHSSEKELKGKVVPDKIRVRVPTVEALIIIKLLSCRNTDIRDIFMMIDKVKNKEFIKKEVSERANFKKQFNKLKEKIISKTFKNNLQGVFGLIQETTFNNNKEKILRLEE